MCSYLLNLKIYLITYAKYFPSPIKMSSPYKFSSRLYPVGTLLLVISAAVLVFFSSRRQSLTIDEPNHLYCGMEWLQEGTYTAWPENPPLSRVFVALGPYLQGFRVSMPTRETAGEYASVWDYFFASYNLDYFSTAPILENLFWIRIFILPLFLLSVLIVWFWAKTLGGKVAAFLAVGMYCTLPPILAHSGLGTTDITFVTFFTLLMFCFSRWLKKPTLKRALLLGLSMGAALLTKFSVLAFFPAAALPMLVLFYVFGLKGINLNPRQWRLKAFKSGTVAAMVAFLSVWAFFGFSVGSLGDEPVISTAIKEGSIPASIGEVIVPAPEWFAGLRLLIFHNDGGHPTYITGQLIMNGIWYYYPLAVLVKTPWPYLLFFFIGFVGAWIPVKSKRNWEAIALSLIPFMILLAMLSSNVNIGLRHILVIYPLTSVGAAVGMLQLLNRVRAKKQLWQKAIPAALVICQLVIAIVAYPKYLSYFNPIAGEDPGEMLNDSDLDWGQGIFELAEFCKENKIEQLSISYVGIGQDCWYGLPQIKALAPDSLATGWIAVSELAYRGVWAGITIPGESCQSFLFTNGFSEKLEPGRGYRWLDQYPLKAILGGSIRMYYVDEKKASQAPVKLKGAVH